LRKISGQSVFWIARLLFFGVESVWRSHYIALQHDNLSFAGMHAKRISDRQFSQAFAAIVQSTICPDLPVNKR
jgi:hypothetical protein